MYGLVYGYRLPISIYTNPYPSLYTIPQPVHHTPAYTPYTSLYTIHQPIHHTPACTPYPSLYTIPQPIHHTPACTPYTSLYTIAYIKNQPIHSTCTEGFLPYMYLLLIQDLPMVCAVNMKEPTTLSDVRGPCSAATLYLPKTTISTCRLHPPPPHPPTPVCPLVTTGMYLCTLVLPEGARGWGGGGGAGGGNCCQRGGISYAMGGGEAASCPPPPPPPPSPHGYARSGAVWYLLRLIVSIEG